MKRRWLVYAVVATGFLGLLYGILLLGVGIGTNAGRASYHNEITRCLQVEIGELRDLLDKGDLPAARAKVLKISDVAAAGSNTREFYRLLNSDDSDFKNQDSASPENAHSDGKKSFEITLAGWVNQPARIDVRPEDKLLGALAKAGGINVFGTARRFYRVRIIYYGPTERDLNPDLPPNLQQIKEFNLNRDTEMTISELGIIAGDILVFDKKRLF